MKMRWSMAKASVAWTVLALTAFPVRLPALYADTMTPLESAASRTPKLHVDLRPAITPKANDAIRLFRSEHYLPPHMEVPDGFADGGRKMKINPDGHLTSGRELLEVDRKKDDFLRKYIVRVQSKEYMDLDALARAVRIGQYVDSLFSAKGGRKGAEPLWSKMETEYASRGVLIGEIAGITGSGVCRHRSLLYKILANAAGLKVSLVRGYYQHHDGSAGAHAWNELYLDDGSVLVVDTMNPTREWKFPSIRQAGIAKRYVGVAKETLYADGHVHWKETTAQDESASALLPKYDHIIIIFEENKDYGQIIGSENAPYINKTLLGSDGGALFTKMHAETHPSQANYIEFFSGSNQGVKDDRQADLPPMTTPNLGTALLANGYTFKGYAEDLPSVGFTGHKSGNYALKHCPWVNWQRASGARSQENSIPAELNVPFCTATDNIHGLPSTSYFPADYSKLPTVSFVIPNQYHEMHSGKGIAQQVKTGDAWLQTYMDGYVQWAQTHNSLLVLTWDEDASDHQADNQLIPTIFVGDHVKGGNYDERINHYNLLRTLEDMYRLPHFTTADSTAAPITDVFRPATH